MSDKSPKNLNERRRDHNRELIRRMRNGDSLKTVDSRASWFPPRPLIQKDADAIHRLYHTPKSPLHGTPSGLDGSAEPLASIKPLSARGKPLNEAS